MLAIVFLLAGCVFGGTVHDFKQSRTLTTASIQQGGMAVMGVIGYHKSFLTKEQAKLNHTMGQILVEGFLKATVKKTPAVKKTLGIANYRAIMAYMRNSLVLPPAKIALLKKKLPHIRYVVFAWLLKTSTTQSSDYEPATTDAHGKVTNNASLTHSTTRFITVRFGVYDLKLGAMVWSGYLNDSDDADLDCDTLYTYPDGTDNYNVGGAYGCDYPAAPSINYVLTDLMGSFLYSFPAPYND